jgi:hypothetical protein
LLQKVILSKYILPKSILLEGLIKDLKEKHWVKLSFFLVASESLTKPTRKKPPLNAQKSKLPLFGLNASLVNCSGIKRERAVRNSPFFWSAQRDPFKPSGLS